MKFTQIARIAVLILLPTLGVAPAADPNPTEPLELKNLRIRYQTELQAAVKPVQQQHIFRLEGLLKSLTIRGDLQGALAVDGELKSLRAQVQNNAPPGEDREADLRTALVKTPWMWGTVKLNFMPDGTVPRFESKWEVTGPRTIFVTHMPTGRTTTFKFDSAVRTFKGLDFDGVSPVEGSRAK